MDVQELLKRAGDHLTIGRAFGAPYERDGTMVIPVALVAGGGGTSGEQSDEAAGGGFGGVVHPLGVYEVRDGRVRFVPTVDVTLLALCWLFVLRLVVKRARGGRLRAGHRHLHG
ncbi:MAG TPA: spore germination protein GerW family protein [Acidimicrobiales bacterium]|nr:spore germination protein GerW family protein [Acidimicrobiales bacterium]